MGIKNKTKTKLWWLWYCVHTCRLKQNVKLGKCLNEKAKIHRWTTKQMQKCRAYLPPFFCCLFMSLFSTLLTHSGQTLTFLCRKIGVWIDISQHSVSKGVTDFGVPLVKIHGFSFDVDSGGLFFFFVRAVKWDAVPLITVTSGGALKSCNRSHRPTSPALWSCRAVPLQSCIIAESVAKEPVAHTFSWKCWGRSE